MNTCNPRTQKARQEDQKLKVIQSYLKNGLKNKQYKKKSTFNIPDRKKKKNETNLTHARTHGHKHTHEQIKEKDLKEAF